MFRLSYEVEHNTGIVTVHSRDHELTMAVAVFLADPLHTLTTAAIQLLLDRDEVQFQWGDEPGTWEWTIQRIGDELKIVITFSELSFGTVVMTDKPRVGFQTTCRLIEFTGQVLSILDRILSDVDIDAYDAEQRQRLWQLQREYRHRDSR